MTRRPYDEEEINMKWSTYVRIPSPDIRHVDPEHASDESDAVLMQVSGVCNFLQDDYQAAVDFGDGWIGAQGTVEMISPLDALRELHDALRTAMLTHGVSAGIPAIKMVVEPYDDTEDDDDE